ncbi:uncharacterized protein LOC130901018 [Diorhabda carinulata]|uniref:uncharacterized protein LOC130901018 n=1 Tax=Diorhabda carinulata TaxID=1163345 RepID=UPI0025A288A4|nr:uncharacterized protein LOC130901018 [Diorhabda carinulata]
MSKSNENQNNATEQPESGNPNVTDTWDKCECNYPKVSLVCECSSSDDDNVKGSAKIKPRMVEIDTNVSEDEKLKDDASPPEKDISSDIGMPSKPAKTDSSVIEDEKATPDSISPDTDSPSKSVEETEDTASKSAKAEDGKNITPDTDSSTKQAESTESEPAESKSPLVEGEKGTPDDISPDTDSPIKPIEDSLRVENTGDIARVDIPGSDIPPDEGETKKLKVEGLEIPSIDCSCRKDGQTLKETNLIARNANCERTFIMVKPDGVHRGLVGKIIKKFEQKGFRLVALSLIWPTEDLLKKHYQMLADKPFFPGLIQYMSSGPVVPMVWEGMGIVSTGRNLLGATNPADSAPGTIRGDLCIQVGRNVCHASDSIDSANNEIALWFTEKEMISWVPAIQPWVYEN